jgi:hypothetical protein
VSLWLVVAASDGAWICRLIDPACVSSDLVRELAAESRQSLIHSLPVVLFVICDAKDPGLRSDRSIAAGPTRRTSESLTD